MTKIDPNLKHKKDAEWMGECPRCQALFDKGYYLFAIRDAHNAAVEAVE